MKIAEQTAFQRSPILRYEGIGSNGGKIVMAYDAFDYAMSKCGLERDPYKEVDSEFKQMFLEWFFSGNWITVREDE